MKDCDLCKKKYEFKIKCEVNNTKITMIKNNEKYCESCYLFIQSIPNPIIPENEEDVYSFSLSPTLRALGIPEDEILLTPKEEEKKKDGKKKKSKRRKKSSTKRKKSLKSKSKRRKK
jgi:hypothetical protein